MALTMIHFKPVKGGSEEHNKREKELEYVRKDLPHEYWEENTQANVHQRDVQLVKEKTGRSMQKKATPMQEAVVLINKDTTMDDLKNLAKEIEQKYGIHCFQISIHKDEGHWRNGEWKPNLHAHMVFNWILDNGKSFRPGRKILSNLQDITADVLHMQRGVSSSAKNLTALQFKNKAEEEYHEQLIEQGEDIRQQYVDMRERLLTAINELDDVQRGKQADIEELQRKQKIVEDKVMNYDEGYSQAVKRLAEKIVLGEVHEWKTTDDNGNPLGIWHRTTKEDIRKGFDNLMKINRQLPYMDRQDEINHRNILAGSLAIHCVRDLTAHQLEEVDEMLKGFADDVPESKYEQQQESKQEQRQNEVKNRGYRMHF